MFNKLQDLSSLQEEFASQSRRSNRSPFIVFFIATLLFSLTQIKPGIIDHTTRFVDFVRAMSSNGVTFFPIIEGHPYPDYLFGAPWLMTISAKLFGHLSFMAIGFPFAVTGALILVMIYKLVSEHDVQWAWFSVLFAGLCWRFIEEVQTFGLDLFPTLASVLCVYLLVRERKGALLSCVMRVGAVLFVMMLSFFLRGPMGIVIPAAVVTCYYVVEKRWKALLVFWFFAFCLLVVCVLGMLLAAYWQGGNAFLNKVMDMQVFERFSKDHSWQPYYYFTLGLANYALTSLFAVWVVWRERQNIFSRDSKTSTLLLLCVFWTLIVLIGMTIPHTKRERYVLAIVPAIAILAGYLFHSKFKNTVSQKVLLAIANIIPWGILASVLGVLIYNQFAATSLVFLYRPALISLIVILFFWMLSQWRFKSLAYQLAVVFLCVASITVFNAYVLKPIGFYQVLALHEDPPTYL
ncbi:MAG: ArnT family glycosyltransferase [Gammaproteobacteria bacterium]